MWYYIIVSFIMIGDIILSRLNSAYHHEMLFKRHINIRNSKLQKLLIWQSDPFGGHNDNQKAYRGKMTILGLSFYNVWLFVLIFSVIFLILGPATSIDPIKVKGDIICSTLNKAVVFMLSLIFLGFSFGFYCLNIGHNYVRSKILWIVWWVIILFMFAVSIAAVVELIRLFN